MGTAGPRGSLQVGKLPMGILEGLLSKYCGADPRVLMGPGIGRDATVIEMGEKLVVVKTDPITFATERIGWYAVHINANDVACVGARPRWFLASLLLPEKATSQELVEEIFSQIKGACGELGCVLCGGHTEISLGLGRPVVVGVMVGEVERGKLIPSNGAKPGDIVLLTKKIAIEGTSLLAREHPKLRDSLTEEEVLRCSELLFSPGISVVREAMAASETGLVHAMHDPTEGGLMTALWEMARACGLDIVVHEEKIPVMEETEKVAEILGIDPMGLLASGSLLISVGRDGVEKVVGAIGAMGVEATPIGEVREGRGNVFISRGRDVILAPMFSRDEAARALEEIC